MVESNSAWRLRGLPRVAAPPCVDADLFSLAADADIRRRGECNEWGRGEAVSAELSTKGCCPTLKGQQAVSGGGGSKQGSVDGVQLSAGQQPRVGLADGAAEAIWRAIDGGSCRGLLL